MPTTTEISDYVSGLSSATLTGAEEVYLATDEKATVQDIVNFGGKVYKAQIDQTGTSAPTLTVLRDDFGLTLTPSYSGVGIFIIDGWSSKLTGLIETNLTGYLDTFTNILSSLTSSQLKIETFNRGVASNGMLTNSGTAIGSSVLTIIKYD